jgi:Ricin-type beta-trefoil lectin domain-like
LLLCPYDGKTQAGEPEKTLTIKTHRVAVFSLIAALTILGVLNFRTPHASASLPAAERVFLTSIAGAPNGGFWLQLDGRLDKVSSGTYAIDGAPGFANVSEPGTIAAIPGKQGYWVVTETGGIFARGLAPALCGGQLSNCSGFPKSPTERQYISAAAATPDGKGLWAVGGDGKLWTAGTAPALGDVTKDKAIPTGIVGTPSGKGYYIVKADGGVFSFGDAVFYGSTGGKRPNGHDATGLALSLDGAGQVIGYWMVFEDGGVFTFGDAPFLGSSGGNGKYAAGIAALPGGLSYAWVHANGQIVLSRTVPSVVIQSKTFGTVWDLPNNSITPTTPVQLFPADGSSSQQWRIFPTNQDSKIVQLVNVNSGLCADLTTSGGVFVIIQFNCKGRNDGWDNQRFKRITGKDGNTDFVPMNKPDYRVIGAGRAAGSALVLQQHGVLNPDPNAVWILINVQ